MNSLTGMRGLLLALPLFLPPLGLSAQGATTPPAGSAPPAGTTPVVATAAVPPQRAGWYSDRRPIRVGDLITVVIDERTVASERISTIARNDRSQVGTLNSAMVPEDLQSFGIGYNAKSDQTGTSDRRGNFVAALTVRVTEIEPGGIVKISGKKNVTLDGRLQAITLSGVIRPDDIVGGNSVLSTRIAEAEISYQGKKIAPKSGLFGKIIGALWP